MLPLLLGAATVVLISKTAKQEMEITITVTVNNLAADLLLTDAPRQRSRFSVSGTPSVLNTIDSRKTACRLDLSGLREGTHNLAVRRPMSAYPRGFSWPRY